MTASPAWSPDGRFIAFIRELESKKMALILDSLSVEAQRRQLETWDVSKMENTLNEPYLAWSPDSKWLAFPYMEAEANNFSLFLISVETGEKQRLTNPPSTATGDTAPAFSPDGHTLAFSRDSWIQSELYLLPLGEGYRPQGEPKRVDTGNCITLERLGHPMGGRSCSRGECRTQACGGWRSRSRGNWLG